MELDAEVGGVEELVGRIVQVIRRPVPRHAKRVDHVRAEHQRVAERGGLRPRAFVRAELAPHGQDVARARQRRQATLERVDVAAKHGVVRAQLVINPGDVLFVVVVERHAVVDLSTRIGCRRQMLRDEHGGTAEERGADLVVHKRRRERRRGRTARR